jgi:hypothetical protein
MDQGWFGVEVRCHMSQMLTVPIDEALAERLRRRAKRDGVAMEEEARKILDRALSAGWTTFWERADQIRASLSGRSFADSAELVRQDRER